MCITQFLVFPQVSITNNAIPYSKCSSSVVKRQHLEFSIKIKRVLYGNLETPFITLILKCKESLINNL